MEPNSPLPALADAFLLPPMDLLSLKQVLLHAKHETFTLWLRTGECLQDCYLLGDTTTWGASGPEQVVFRVVVAQQEMQLDGARVADAIIPGETIEAEGLVALPSSIVEADHGE